MLDNDPQRLVKIKAHLELAVRLSRGLYKKIAHESGCRRKFLARIANDPDYDPPIGQLALVDAWFQKNGVPRETGWGQRAASG